jgi:hypothetical protein
MPQVTAAIRGLIAALKPRCIEVRTLDQLADVVEDHARWRTCHDLFQRIRKKTLPAQSAGDKLLEAQYLFEEVCAETLYNLSREPAPFDSDVPFWISPNASYLGRTLNISD